MASSYPFISIAIPAYNEEKYIGDCLESLKNQDYPKDRYEIIVETSGSTDNTGEIAKKFGAKVVHSEKRGGVAMARQMGSAAARKDTDIIGGTDADTVVPSTWLSVIAENLQKPGVVGVTGPVTTKNSHWMDRLSFQFAFGMYNLVGFFMREQYFPGMNFAVNAQVFHKIGGFRPELRSGEDLDLSVRVGRHGKIVFDKRLIVYTSERRLKEGKLHSFLRYTKAYFAIKCGFATPAFVDYR